MKKISKIALSVITTGLLFFFFLLSLDSPLSLFLWLNWPIFLLLGWWNLSNAILLNVILIIAYNFTLIYLIISLLELMAKLFKVDLSRIEHVLSFQKDWLHSIMISMALFLLVIFLPNTRINQFTLGKMIDFFETEYSLTCTIYQESCDKELIAGLLGIFVCLTLFTVLIYCCKLILKKLFA